MRVAHRTKKPARLRGVGFLAQQARLEQRLADTRDFRIADLGQRRPHDGARLAAKMALRRAQYGEIREIDRTIQLESLAILRR